MEGKELWELYCKESGEDINAECQVWAFGGLPDMLAALAIEGIKTGTSSGYFWYEAGEPEPKPGDYSVVIDSCGEAVCVLQTTRTEAVPFDEVSEEFAAKEGEGDRSLDYWRDVHEEFFSNELEGTNMEFTPDMLVLTEEFEVKYSIYSVEDIIITPEGGEEKAPEMTCIVRKFGEKIAFFNIVDNCGSFDLSMKATAPDLSEQDSRMVMAMAMAKTDYLFYGSEICFTDVDPEFNW